MLKQRVMTALVLVAAILWLLFAASEQAWRWSFLAVAAVGAWEWAAFAGRKLLQERLAFIIVVEVALYFVLNASHDIQQIILYSAIPLLFVVMTIVVLYQKREGQAVVTHSGLVLLLGLWTLVVFTLSMVTLRHLLTPSEILLSMLSIWAIDTGAYFAGRQFGKTKLAVYVSPGKTWEGVVGGGLLSFGVVMIGGMSVVEPLKISPVTFALLATLIALLSVFGDLFQSVLKRQVGLKDSGKILPGHGGILDRIDSLLIAMPLFTLLWMGSLQ